MNIDTKIPNKILANRIQWSFKMAIGIGHFLKQTYLLNTFEAFESLLLLNIPYFKNKCIIYKLKKVSNVSKGVIFSDSLRKD